MFGIIALYKPIVGKLLPTTGHHYAVTMLVNFNGAIKLLEEFEKLILKPGAGW